MVARGLMSGDLAAFFLAVPVGLFMIAGSNVDPWFFLEEYKGSLLPVGLTYILILYVANLYDHYQDFRRRENFSRVILSCLVGTMVVVLLFCFPAWRIIPRNFIEWHAVAFIWLTVLWRYSFSAFALPTRLQRNVLIIGAGTSGREIATIVRQRPNSGLRVIGFVDDNPRKAEESSDEVPILGTSLEIPRLIKQHRVGLVVLAITHEKSSRLLDSLAWLPFRGNQLTDMPSLYEFLTGKVPTDFISDLWLFLNSLNRRMVYYCHLKRFTDLVLAVFCLALTWPLMLVVALAVKLDSSGPIFYRQERLGQDGKPFQIIKFRTMVEHAEQSGPQFARSNDSRITRIGRILRTLRLDELAQLLNIMKGEMSFIGPRPEREVLYSGIPGPGGTTAPQPPGQRSPGRPGDLRP